MSTAMTETDTLPGLAPWVEGIQAIKDDVDEPQHVLTVLGLGLCEALMSIAFVSLDTRPMLYHACEVLAHHGLIDLTPTEAPGWYVVSPCEAGKAAVKQALRDRDADLANREGRMR